MPDLIYRCELCEWTTTHYDEIDGHEGQIEPGHLVSLDVEATGRTALMQYHPSMYNEIKGDLTE